MKRYDKLVLVRTLESRFPFYKNANRVKKIALSLILSPFAVSRLIKSKHRFIMPYLEIVLTEHCSLRCKDCANLMQYYKTPRHYSFDSIKRDVEQIEKSVREISVCQVLGGEPFLNPEFAEIISFLNSKQFIKNIQVVTNGTIIPRNAVLQALKSAKIAVHISNYGESSPRVRELIALLQREHIAYKALNYSSWFDYGDLSDKKLTKNEIDLSYKTCASAECKTLLNGRIFSCPRSAHMHNLGVLIDDSGSLTVDETLCAKKLSDFYNKKQIGACAYCIPTDKRAEIPPAVQQNKERMT